MRNHKSIPLWFDLVSERAFRDVVEANAKIILYNIITLKFELTHKSKLHTLMKQIPNMLIFIHTDRLLKNNHSNWKSYDKPLPPILIWKSLMWSYGETLITSHQGLSNQNAYLKRFFNQISILNQINQSHMLLVITQLGESTFKFLMQRHLSLCWVLFL